MGGEAYFTLAMEERLWRAFRSFPRRRLYSRFPPRPCEKAMRAYAGAQEARLGLLAVYIFIRRGAQAALIAWMSGCTPRMAIIRFRL
jgi:hypothetical protein